MHYKPRVTSCSQCEAGKLCGAGWEIMYGLQTNFSLAAAGGKLEHDAPGAVLPSFENVSDGLKLVISKLQNAPVHYALSPFAGRIDPSIVSMCALLVKKNGLLFTAKVMLQKAQKNYPFRMAHCFLKPQLLRDAAVEAQEEAFGIDRAKTTANWNASVKHYIRYSVACKLSAAKQPPIRVSSDPVDVAAFNRQFLVNHYQTAGLVLAGLARKAL